MEVKMETFEQRAIRVWMRSVMDDKNWTANKWAVLAGTSPSNITRFVRGSKFTPSSATIAKLAYVAGSHPVLSRNEITKANVNSVIIYDTDDNRLGVISVYGIKGSCKGYKVEKDYPSCNISANDIVIVREDKSFSVNNIVAFNKNSEFVITKATDKSTLFMCCDTSNVLHKKDMTLLGRVVQIIKNLDDTDII
tara:strand:+ start:795 stop:1376 length:582 start_codon:yes stop_codon:yes gene_type:complete